MKRFKVKITDRNGFFKQFDDGSCIGGSYGDPITLTMCLNKPEHEALLLFMRQVSEKQHDVAVFNLSQCCVLSDWHRRMMRKYFKAFTQQVTIELL
jgi:hypothetical protein